MIGNVGYCGITESEAEEMKAAEFDARFIRSLGNQKMPIASAFVLGTILFDTNDPEKIFLASERGAPFDLQLLQLGLAGLQAGWRYARSASVGAAERELASGMPHTSGPPKPYWVDSDRNGTQWMTFKADEAVAFRSAPRDHANNPTPETRVGVSPRGRPFVWEGVHRAIGAAHGEQIPAELGGTPIPGWLRYQYTPISPGSNGYLIRDMTVSRN